MIYLAALIMILGTGFLLVAAIGVVRLADPLQRMHSAAKAGTLGGTLLLIGALLSGAIDLPGTSVLTVLFLLVTLPLGAQLLARASYVSGTKLEGIAHDPLSAELDRHENRPEELMRED